MLINDDLINMIVHDDNLTINEKWRKLETLKMDMLDLIHGAVKEIFANAADCYVEGRDNDLKN